MKQEDLFEAIGAIEEERLAATEKTVRKPRLIRIAAIAAIIMLLTACGVTVGTALSYKIGQETVSEKEFYAGSIRNNPNIQWKDVTMYTVDVDTKMAPQVLNDQVYAKLKKFTTNHWKEDSYGGRLLNYFIGKRAGGCNPFVSNLAELEEYLEIGLAVSPETRQAVSDYISATGRESGYLELYIGDVQKAHEEFQQTKQVSPSYINLNLPLEYTVDEDNMKDTRVRLTVHIPLTEEYVEENKVIQFASQEESGAFKVEERTFGGHNVLIIYNDPQPGAWGHAIAIYNVNGIVYEINAWDKEGDGDSLEMLMPYFENWKE